MKLRNILTVFLLSIYCISYGQNFKKEHRIYMLDITKSMWGLDDGPDFDIFDDVKEELYRGIQNIKDPETLVTVIPFQATHTYEKLESWTFKKDNENAFLKMKKTIDSYSLETVPGGYTDIYSALEKAKEQLKSSYINYVFLLTDGQQSPVPSSHNRVNTVEYSKQDLLDAIANWCEYSKGKDVYLFYAMLTDIAVDQEVINLIEEQCNAYTTTGTNFNIAFLKPESNKIRLNLHDDPNNIEIKLEANDWEYLPENLSIKGSLDDNNLFELVNSQAVLNKNKKSLSFKLKNKNNVSYQTLRESNPIDNSLSFRLSSTEEVKLLEPDFEFIVKNKKEKVLKLYFSDDE